LARCQWNARNLTPKGTIMQNTNKNSKPSKSSNGDRETDRDNDMSKKQGGGHSSNQGGKSGSSGSHSEDQRGGSSR
jgi:hypothetical protein